MEEEIIFNGNFTDWTSLADEFLDELTENNNLPETNNNMNDDYLAYVCRMYALTIQAWEQKRSRKTFDSAYNDAIKRLDEKFEKSNLDFKQFVKELQKILIEKARNTKPKKDKQPKRQSRSSESERQEESTESSQSSQSSQSSEPTQSSESSSAKTSSAFSQQASPVVNEGGCNMFLEAQGKLSFYSILKHLLMQGAVTVPDELSLFAQLHQYLHENEKYLKFESFTEISTGKTFPEKLREFKSTLKDETFESLRKQCDSPKKFSEIYRLLATSLTQKNRPIIANVATIDTLQKKNLMRQKIASTLTINSVSQANLYLLAFVLHTFHRICSFRPEEEEELAKEFLSQFINHSLFSQAQASKSNRRAKPEFKELMVAFYQAVKANLEEEIPILDLSFTEQIELLQQNKLNFPSEASLFVAVRHVMINHKQFQFVPGSNYSGDFVENFLEKIKTNQLSFESAMAEVKKQKIDAIAALYKELAINLCFNQNLLPDRVLKKLCNLYNKGSAVKVENWLQAFDLLPPLSRAIFADVVTVLRELVIRKAISKKSSDFRQIIADSVPLFVSNFDSSAHGSLTELLAVTLKTVMNECLQANIDYKPSMKTVDAAKIIT